MNALRISTIPIAAALLASAIGNPNVFAAPAEKLVEAERNVVDEDSAKDNAKSFYVVDRYDPRRDPMTDLRATARRAADENKRIIIQVGGNWCGWCHILSRTFEQDPQVNALLRENFVVMKVSVDQANPNREFLSHLPPFEAFPQLFILEPNGKLLHAQDPTPFEAARGYKTRAVLEFLQQWTPAEKPER